MFHSGGRAKCITCHVPESQSVPEVVVSRRLGRELSVLAFADQGTPRDY